MELGNYSCQRLKFHDGLISIDFVQGDYQKWSEYLIGQSHFRPTFYLSTAPSHANDENHEFPCHL